MPNVVVLPFVVSQYMLSGCDADLTKMGIAQLPTHPMVAMDEQDEQAQQRARRCAQPHRVHRHHVPRVDAAPHRRQRHARSRDSTYTTAPRSS
jgi:hypothetical protein